MSETVYYKGTIKRTKIEGHEAIEKWAENFCKENKKKLKTYHDSYTEWLTDEYYQKYVVVDDILWEVLTKETLDPESDLYNMKHIKENTYEYELRYYNGGCRFTEALEEAFENVEEN